MAFSVGQTVAPANSDELNIDAKLACQFTAARGRITELYVYMDGNGSGTGNGTVRGVIYDDTGANLPNNQLGAGVDVTITDGQAFGWVRLPFSTPVDIASTAKFWIGVHNGGVATPQLKRDATGGFVCEAQLPSADTFSDGSEATWSGTGHAPSQQNYAFYVLVEPYFSIQPEGRFRG